MCLTLFDEPVTLRCGHSLCTACKDNLVQSKTREVAPAVRQWQAHPAYPKDHAYYKVYRTRVEATPAVILTYSTVLCPSCRAESACDLLATSVQLRASIGALFPEQVQARATVKRLTSALEAVRANEAVRLAAHLPRVEEKAAALKAAAAAEQRKAKAIAAEANEAGRLAKARAKAAEAKAELDAAQKALDALETAQKALGGAGGKKGAAAGQKRKR